MDSPSCRIKVYADCFGAVDERNLPMGRYDVNRSVGPSCQSKCLLTGQGFRPRSWRSRSRGWPMLAFRRCCPVRSPPSAAGRLGRLRLECATPRVVRRRLPGRPRVLLHLRAVHAQPNDFLVFDRQRHLAIAEQLDRELPPVAQHRDLAVEALAHRHRGAAQPVALAVASDLVGAPLEADRQVPRHFRACCSTWSSVLSQQWDRLRHHAPSEAK